MTTPLKAPPIAPCPFCGRKWRSVDWTARWLKVTPPKAGETLTEVVVTCPECYAHTVRVLTHETDLTWSKISAINFWNRREPPETHIEDEAQPDHAAPHRPARPRRSNRRPRHELH